MRITFREAPARAILRVLALLLHRLRRIRAGRRRLDEDDLAQRVRLSGEW